MGNVTVVLCTILTKVCGETRASVEAATIEEAVQLLCARFGKEFRDQLYNDKGEIKPYFIFLVDGEMADIKHLDKTALAPGQILRILAPVGGG